MELVTTRIPMELMVCLDPTEDLAISDSQDSVEAMDSKAAGQLLPNTQLGRGRLTTMIITNPEDLTIILCINLQGRASCAVI